MLHRMRNLTRLLFTMMTMIALAGEVRPMDLHEAARKGDMAEMTATLKSGVDINVRNAAGETALLVAVRRGVKGTLPFHALFY